MIYPNFTKVGRKTRRKTYQINILNGLSIIKLLIKTSNFSSFHSKATNIIYNISFTSVSLQGSKEVCN